MIYEYNDSNSDKANGEHLKVEIQVRTRLQHIWATAVEVMGLYSKSALKAGKGDADILRFFVLVSALFAKTEGITAVPDTPADKDDIIREIIKIDAKTRILSSLEGISSAMHSLPDNKNDTYYIMVLDYQLFRLAVQGFTENEFEIASKVYDHIESMIHPYIDVVLVSTESVNDLRSAYPNYFADVREFLRIVRKETE